MMRGVLFFLVIFVIYSALKTVVRSAVKAYHHDEQQPRQADHGR